EGQGKERGWIEIGLIEEEVCVEGIEALFGREIAGHGRQAISGVQNALENVGGVHRRYRICGAGAAGTPTGEDELHGLGRIRSIAEEVEAEQRVIVEHAVGGADHVLAIALGIPSDADARLEIVLVGLNAFLDSELVVSGGGKTSRRRKLRRNFHVVADAVVERQLVAESPGILKVETKRHVLERIARVAGALNQSARYAETIGLDGGEARETSGAGWEAESVGTQAAEGINAAVVDRECGVHRDVVHVGAELEVVPPVSDREVVGELVALFDALDKRVGFTAEVSEAGDVDGDVRSSGRTRVEILQSATGVLEPEFINLIAAENPGVLRYAAGVAVGLL